MDTNRYARENPGHQVIPKPALYAAAGLIAITVIASGFGVLFGDDTSRVDRINPVHTVTLRFVEREDETIDVYEPEGGALFTTLTREENGFVRGIMRAVGHVRRMKRAPADSPVDLIQDQGGAISVHDPATGKVYPLRGHGEGNYRIFAQLLTQRMESGT